MTADIFVGLLGYRELAQRENTHAHVHIELVFCSQFWCQWYKYIHTEDHMVTMTPINIHRIKLLLSVI